jgi:hypothetical protein
MVIQLKDFLADAAIDIARTLVLRHTPTERRLRARLQVWAAEQPDMFNTYQSSHLPRQEKMLMRAARVVSCIGHEPSQALFVGVYEVRGYQPISDDEYWAMPAHQEMRKLGSSIRQSTLLFDLHQMNSLSELAGKLVIGWPPLDRAWARWAEKNVFPVRAIHTESALVRPMPPWRELVLDWSGRRNRGMAGDGRRRRWRAGPPRRAPSVDRPPTRP